MGVLFRAQRIVLDCRVLCCLAFLFAVTARCLRVTGCDGVMSSEAVLERPGLFSDNVSAVTGLRVSQVSGMLGFADFRNISIK